MIDHQNRYTYVDFENGASILIHAIDTSSAIHAVFEKLYGIGFPWGIDMSKEECREIFLKRLGDGEYGLFRISNEIHT